MLARFKLGMFLIVLCNSIQLSPINITVVNKTTRKISTVLYIKRWCCSHKSISKFVKLDKDKPFKFNDSNYNKNIGIFFIIDEGRDEHEKYYDFESGQNFNIIIGSDKTRSNAEADSIFIYFPEGKLLEKIDLWDEIDKSCFSS